MLQWRCIECCLCWKIMCSGSSLLTRNIFGRMIDSFTSDKLLNKLKLENQTNVEGTWRRLGRSRPPSPCHSSPLKSTLALGLELPLGNTTNPDLMNALEEYVWAISVLKYSVLCTAEWWLTQALAPGQNAERKWLLSGQLSWSICINHSLHKAQRAMEEMAVERF